MAFTSRSTALMKHIECESLRLSRGRWIFDRPPRWSHVASVINNARDVCRLILIERSDAFFVGFYLNRYNSFWSTVEIKMIRRRMRSRHLPSALSEDRRSWFFARSDALQATTSPPRLDRWSWRDQTLLIAPGHLHNFKISEKFIFNYKNRFLILKIMKNSLKIQKNLEKSLKIKKFITFKI